MDPDGLLKLRLPADAERPTRVRDETVARVREARCHHHDQGQELRREARHRHCDVRQRLMLGVRLVERDAY